MVNNDANDVVLGIWIWLNRLFFFVSLFHHGNTAIQSNFEIKRTK